MEHGPIRVGMVIVMQHDLAKAVDFYKNIFNMPLKFHLEGKWAEFDLGCVKFGLCPIDQFQDNVRTGIVLQVEEDLLNLYETLKDKVTFLNEPVVAVHGIMLGFKDVGGNILDLYQPTHDKVKDLVEQVAQNTKKSGE